MEFQGTKLLIVEQYIWHLNYPTTTANRLTHRISTTLDVSLRPPHHNADLSPSSRPEPSRHPFCIDSKCFNLSKPIISIQHPHLHFFFDSGFCPSTLAAVLLAIVTHTTIHSLYPRSILIIRVAHAFHSRLLRRLSLFHRNISQQKLATTVNYHCSLGMLSFPRSCGFSFSDTKSVQNLRMEKRLTSRHGNERGEGGATYQRPSYHDTHILYQLVVSMVVDLVRLYSAPLLTRGVGGGVGVGLN